MNLKTMQILLRTTLLLLLTVCAGTAQAEITIALAAPLSGTEIELGLDLQAGADAAVTAVNQDGGVLGEPLKLEAVDDRCDAKEGAIKANELGRRHLAAVIGHACSGASVPASLVYEEDGVLMMTASSSVPKLTERGLKLTFRLFGRDDRLVETIADYVISHYADKQIAVVHDNRGYGKGIADNFKDELNKHNIKEAGYEIMAADLTGTQVLFSHLKAMKADVVFYGGYYKDMVRLVHDAGVAGFNPVFVTAEAASRSTFAQAAGPSAEGVLYCTLAADTSNPQVAAITKTIEQSGRKANLYTLASYAAVRIWADAAKHVGSTDAEKIAKLLREKDFDSVLGKVRFDEKGDARGISYQIYQWTNGVAVPVANAPK